MIRRPCLFLAWGLLGWGQSASSPTPFVAAPKAFLHAVDALQQRMYDGQSIDTLDRLREEAGLSLVSAVAVLETVRAYNAEADRVEKTMRSSILTRRLQVAGQYVVTYSSELDVVNWANLDLNLFLLEQMDSLQSSLGEVEYQKLANFIQDRFSADSFFPLRPGETGPSGKTTLDAWKQSPLGFWRDSIKGPLSGPGAEALFVESFQDVLLPPPDIVSYLEGTVVAVTPEDSQGWKVLLSMQGDGVAEAALVIDGVDWKWTAQPEVGAVVRFAGVAREFSKEPFLVQFVPERITGLPLATEKPNLPFTIPGLAR